MYRDAPTAQRRHGRSDVRCSLPAIERRFPGLRNRRRLRRHVDYPKGAEQRRGSANRCPLRPAARPLVVFAEGRFFPTANFAVERNNSVLASNVSAGLRSQLSSTTGLSSTTSSSSSSSSDRSPRVPLIEAAISPPALVNGGLTSERRPEQPAILSGLRVSGRFQLLADARRGDQVSLHRNLLAEHDPGVEHRSITRCPTSGSSPAATTMRDPQRLHAGYRDQPLTAAVDSLEGRSARSTQHAAADREAKKRKRIASNAADADRHPARSQPSARCHGQRCNHSSAVYGQRDREPANCQRT